MGKRKVAQGLDPVWEHVKVLVPAASSRGKPKVLCTHCALEFVAGTTRCKEHFRGDSTNVKACPEVPADLHSKLAAEQIHKQSAANRKRKLEALDKITAGSDELLPAAARFTPRDQQTISGLFNKDAKAKCDAGKRFYLQGREP